MPREVCETIEITRAKEVCKETPKSIPNIKCESKMKEIELKEICIDIALQLPREECKRIEKEECKIEPKEVVVQQCEPTVKEVCKAGVETICDEKCNKYYQVNHFYSSLLQRC